MLVLLSSDMVWVLYIFYTGIWCEMSIVVKKMWWLIILLRDAEHPWQVLIFSEGVCCSVLKGHL